MSDIDNASQQTPPPAQPSSPDEVEAMEAMFKNAKATENEPTSVAPWLLKDFTTHKNRLIKGLSAFNLSLSYPIFNKKTHT
jgi:hypothetical protein